MLETIRKALGLLDARSRRILLVLVIIQVGIASLDLVGVFLLGAVAALSAAAVSGQDPALIGDLLGRFGVSSSGELPFAVTLAVVAGLVLIVKSILSFLLVRRSYRFLANRQALISSRLASKLLSRPLLDVQRRSSQQTAYALTAGVNAATIGVLGSAVIIAAEAAVFLVLFAGLLFIDPVVALFTLIFFGVIGVTVYRIVGSWARRLGMRVSTAEIASITSVQDAVRTYREVTVTGRRGLFVDRFQTLRWEAASVQADLQIMSQVSKYVFEVALVVGAGALAVSQFLTRDAIAAIAVIAIFLTAASRIMPALLRMQGSILAVRAAGGTATPTLELADELSGAPTGSGIDSELRDRCLSGIVSGFAGFTPDLQVHEVALTYPGADQPAIQGATIQVDAGTSLALVGPTGAGKSTLADLILGVLEPDSGRIELSGVTPDEASRVWPGAIAYVPQETSVLEGTIRSNVALGIPVDVVDDDLIWDALRRAHLDPNSMGSSNGLETVVGENGVRLSGGQRQRLGLARALFTRPRFIVLDEATSALDAETERAVSQALEELEGEVTLVIVAHRLATIRHCDQVAYIEDGHIKALGSFDEVRSVQPRFDRQAELLGL